MKYLLCIFIIGLAACNDNSQPPLKPSNFAAPIVDTVATKIDSNAYIIAP